MFITTKLLGILSGGLGAAALAASAFAGIQTHRLHETQGTVTALRDNLDRAAASFDRVVEVANDRAQALQGRDEIIKAQSGSIDAIAAQRAQDRATYVSGILQADRGAKTHEARAAELVQAPAKAPDDRCEAARALIEQEMLGVR
ncbi:hypothetical protein [Sphingomonas melonis]|uniref:hypothetical protein n=1 Tax=Sphingomonas melonis TaxID=152682 RepID=UPI0035C85E58